jgi:hypothetical protein
MTDMRWRDAKKELPEEDEDVIYSSDGISVSCELGKYSARDGVWKEAWNFDGCEKEIDVMFWMPLPSPPNEHLIKTNRK